MTTRSFNPFIKSVFTSTILTICVIIVIYTYRHTSSIRSVSEIHLNVVKVQKSPVISKRNIISIAPYTFNITMCTLAKNEGRYLQEWLQFNIMTGVNKIVIYDDGSNDSTVDVLSQYKNLVIRHSFPPQNCSNWPSTFSGHCQSCQRGDGRSEPHSQLACQFAAYKHCVYHYTKTSQWLGFIDVDEFIYPCASSRKSTLTEILKQKNNYGDMRLECFKFGTSNYSKPLPTNQTYLRTHLWRAPYRHLGEPEDSIRQNSHCAPMCESAGGQKYMTHTSNININTVVGREINIHRPIRSGGQQIQTIDRNEICCNHYTQRSTQEAVQKAKKNHNAVLRDQMKNQASINYHNSIKDTDIVKYLNMREKEVL